MHLRSGGRKPGQVVRLRDTSAGGHDERGCLVIYLPTAYQTLLCKSVSNHSSWVNKRLPGCRSFGRHAPKMVNPPFSKPEAPKPETARAIINILEDIATAHRRDPSSKVKRNIRKAHCEKQTVLLAQYTRQESGNARILTLILK